VKRDHAATPHERRPRDDVRLARLIGMIAVDENKIDRAALRRE
jgi:hypothetical protein